MQKMQKCKKDVKSTKSTNTRAPAISTMTKYKSTKQKNTKI